MKVDGCKIELLAGCQLSGEYRLRPTPEGLQSLTISSDSELSAKLPFAIAELGGHLKQSGVLSLRYFVRGVSYATAPALYRSDLKQGCEGATHFVLNYVAGAYEIGEQSRESEGASAGVLGVGAKGEKSRTAKSLMRGGSFADCAGSKPGCLAPVRLRLLPIIETQPVGVQAEAHQAALTRPAPGTQERTTLDRGAIVKVVSTLKPAIAACRQEHQPGDGFFTIKALVDVGADGVVRKVDVDSSTSVNPAFVKCVQDSLYSARFPAAKDPISFRYPFTF